ncbi:hypothetical protein AVL50_27375 [Flammeovirga sp. SJP92]|nr:hypothetical protein AVL50_27375 [Flammeovirga sp. SJP92]
MKKASHAYGEGVISTIDICGKAGHNIIRFIVKQFFRLFASITLVFFFLFNYGIIKHVIEFQIQIHFLMKT